MRNLNRIKPLLATLILALVLGGCLGITGIGNNHSSDVISDGRPSQPSLTIPKSDAELASHVPFELIVGVQPDTDPASIAQAIDAEIIDSLAPINAIRLRLNGERSITDTMRALNELTGVRYAQPNYTEYHLSQTAVPDDPDFESYQYGPQRIHAPTAWAQGITGRGTIIAILDTGIDPLHPDLADNILLGFNTMDMNFNIYDTDGHGTHVAGIAAAVANNGIGMAGVAPEAKILPLKVFNDNGLATDYAISLAILIAAEPTLVQGLGVVPADVINMSLGSPVYSQLRQDAINYALENNVVVVAAMGNDFKQMISYPAANEGVIAVGATDPHDRRANFSSTGPHISVSAPGQAIYSTIPGGGYVRWSGTSMAAPHVAGAAALIRQLHPGLSPMEVQHLLERTADASGGFTRELGYGRINVARALDIEDVTTDRGTLKLVLTDSLGYLIPEADVILYRNDQVVGNVRTGGYVTGYEGSAYFYNLAPGNKYKLTIRLDPALHGIQFIEAVENISIRDNEITEIVVQLDIP